MEINITLPWPPSANTYWRRNSGRYFICKKGKDYRSEVMLSLQSLQGVFKSDERLSIKVYAFPPDKRKRDLDNITKCLFDSLQHAKVFEDDSQIDEIYVKRLMPLEGIVKVKLSNAL